MTGLHVFLLIVTGSGVVANAVMLSRLFLDWARAKRYGFLNAEVASGWKVRARWSIGLFIILFTLGFLVVAHATGTHIWGISTSRLRLLGFLVVVGVACWLTYRLFVDRFHSDVLMSEKLSQTIETVPFVKALWNNVPVVIVDRDTGVIRYCSPASDKLFGYSFGSLIGCSVDELVPDSVRQRHAEHRQTFAQHPQSRPMGRSGMKLDGRKRNGELFPVDVQLFTVPEVDGTPAVVAMVTDLSVLSHVS